MPEAKKLFGAKDVGVFNRWRPRIKRTPLRDKPSLCVFADSKGGPSCAEIMLDHQRGGRVAGTRNRGIRIGCTADRCSLGDIDHVPASPLAG